MRRVVKGHSKWLQNARTISLYKNEDRRLRGIGTASQQNDCVVALRACGAVADMAIEAAVDSGAAFVVSPCCLWKAVAKTTSKGGRMPTTAPPSLEYPRSAWLAGFDVSPEDYVTLVDADEPPAARASAMLGDGARTRLFRQARRILEEDRLRYASERGYDVRLLRFEGGDNPPTSASSRRGRASP